MNIDISCFPFEKLYVIDINTISLLVSINHFLHVHRKHNYATCTSNNDTAFNMRKTATKRRHEDILKLRMPGNISADELGILIFSRK